MKQFLSAILILFLSLPSQSTFMPDEPREIPVAKSDSPIIVDVDGFKNTREDNIDFNIYMRKKVKYGGKEFAIVYNSMLGYSGIRDDRATVFIGLCRWENSEQLSKCIADSECDTRFVHNLALDYYGLFSRKKQPICDDDKKRRVNPSLSWER